MHSRVPLPESSSLTTARCTEVTLAPEALVKAIQVPKETEGR